MPRVKLLVVMAVIGDDVETDACDAFDTLATHEPDDIGWEVLGAYDEPYEIGEEIEFIAQACAGAL